MPKGLRAGDANDIRRIVGPDLRLLLRVGALLEARLCFSALALETLVADEAGRKLLADRRLGQEPAAVLAAAGRDDLQVISEPDGWRTIALADEIGNPLAETAAPAAEAGLPALAATLSPALRAPVEGLLQAREADQRAAALEQLRYVGAPLPVVGELMPLLLADSAELVRERAIALVVASGGHAVVVDLVRALQRRDEAALARVTGALSALPAEQQDLAIAAVVAQAVRGEVTRGLIAAAAALAPRLAGHRALERLLELLLPSPLSLLDLVRALQERDAARVAAALRRGLGFGPEQDARILVLLAAPGAAFDDALLERGVDLLLSPDEEPRERLPLAAALRRADPGQTLARRIAARGMRLIRAHDTSVHWLLAELARDGAIDADTADALADLLRRLLREAEGPHLVTALEQQLPVLLPCRPEARAALALPLVEALARYRAERTVDLVTSALVGIGEAALPTVWDALEHHPLPRVRLQLAALLPDIVLRGSQPAAAARRLLALGAGSEQGEERGALAAAAARILAEGAPDDRELARAVDEACAGLGRHAYEALGYLAASAACDPARRAAIVEDLLIQACAELPDAPAHTSTDPATGEVTYELDERLAAHTELVPRILAALTRIARSAPGAEHRVRIVDRLVAQWRRVAAWKLVWGPGNVHALAEALAAIASDGHCPAHVRVRIADALAPQVGQLAVARALARVLIVGEGEYLARIAARAADQLVRLAVKPGEFTEDEREELAEALADFLAVPRLGPDEERLRRRLIDVLATLRDQVSSRARARLRFVRDGLPPPLAALLDWV